MLHSEFWRSRQLESDIQTENVYSQFEYTPIKYMVT